MTGIETFYTRRLIGMLCFILFLALLSVATIVCSGLLVWQGGWYGIGGLALWIVMQFIGRLLEKAIPD